MMRNRLGGKLLLVCALIAVVASGASVDDDVQQLLRAGDKLMLQGRGSYQDAISKYTQAINLDPRNAKSLYRRAELYSMMKEREESMADLKAVLAVEPNHKQGLTLRAKLLGQQGLLLEASRDYAMLANIYRQLKNEKKTNEAKQHAETLHRLGQEWAMVRENLKSEEYQLKRAANQHCVKILEEVISQYAKDSLQMHLWRAECAQVSRNQIVATEEIKYIVKRDPHNLQAAVLSASAFRALGAVEQAKSEVKRCLTLDPEFGPCSRLHKQIKQYAKQTAVIEALVGEKKWVEAQGEIDVALGMEEDPPNLEQLWKWKCQGYASERDVEKGISACTKAIEIEGGATSPMVLDLLLWRADLHCLNDDYDAAEADVRAAGDLHVENDKVNKARQKIANLRKAAERKDYYKILGVKKTASTKEIRTAFRHLAMTLHPDQLRSKEMTDEERQKAELQFRDINEAKEMLLDEEKRQRYDNGEDVANPQQQQQQGFHFGGQQGFHFDFGGPGNFEFHFG